ncbi:MAG: hypothetical protein JEZ06_20290, partial [Anaerolineaceae bacterium]|nr:hypothetical protein [Anaerolineaceae bacterium]
MRKKMMSLVILILLLFSVFSPVSAQTYYFSVPRSEINVFINSDGTIDIEYIIDFYNDTSADPIDYVDIGLPNSNYSISGITAKIDGKNVNHIANSQYVSPGIELGLGADSIQPGDTGRVHVWINSIPDVFFNSKEPENYASINFSPNWFGSQYVFGKTEMIFTY